jgi:hypothetical protein
MGEKGMKSKALAKRPGQAAGCCVREEERQIETPGGRAHVRWDEKGSATALGQPGFLAEFLEETGLFERWGKRCPLDCASPDAPEGVDVPGSSV